MPRALVCFALLSGCAVDRAARVEDPVCCEEASPPDVGRGVDFAERAAAPERCVADARALLPGEAAWRALWGCVADPHFTALRPLLDGAWDRELSTRPDAPLLVARVIAQRGGNVDEDLRALHARRVPLFALSQALAQPERYRGALVIVRARASLHGVLAETRLVSHAREVELGPTERVATRGPWRATTRTAVVQRRAENLDVATGQRVLCAPTDPFLDEDEPVVMLARFDGLRDGDGWPAVTPLAHFLPSATLSY